MKALLFLLALSLTAPSMAGVTGNGGGGVKQNGVYKTFYSAGMYVSPEAESEIPGAEVYTNTILSIAGENKSTARLLSLGLPIAERKFYKILEDRMEAGVMDRLLNEYARIVNQPVKDITLFAITDIREQTTYLLPTFYKLSENEQAAILFHEAYWIMNPRASYPEVVAAESSFQKYIEARQNGEFDSELVKILGKVLEDESLALKTSYAEDVRLQKVSSLISKDASIKVSHLFVNNKKLCSTEESNSYDGSSIFGNSKYKTTVKVKCTLGYTDLQDVLALSRKNPNSYFLKELMRFISAGNFVYAAITFPKNTSSAKAIEKLFDSTVDFTRLSTEDMSYKKAITIFNNDLK